MSHLTLGLDGIFGLWLRAQNCPMVSNTIAMLLDPAPRINLEPFQPHAWVARIEQAQLESSETTAQLARARHAHVLVKLTAQPRHGEVKPCGRQNERELVGQT